MYRQYSIPKHRSVIVGLALAGIVGPILFAVVVIVQFLLRPDHDPVAWQLSALAAGPVGWVQSLNFVITGVLLIACAVGLHLGMDLGRTGVTGPALLALSGVGMVWAGVFPAADASAAFNPAEVPTLHVVGAFMTFLGAGIGLILLSRRMLDAPLWQNLAVYALATGIVVVFLFLVIGGFARLPGDPLDAWTGVLQAVAVTVWFTCTVVLALRLLRAHSRELTRSGRSRSRGLGVRNVRR